MCGGKVSRYCTGATVVVITLAKMMGRGWEGVELRVES
jgi:hypothetical protein